MTPSAFEMGRALGGNVSGGIREAAEQNLLDRILRESENQQLSSQDIGRVLNQFSTEKRDLASQVLTLQQAQQKEARAQQAFNQIADRIEMENPDSSHYKQLAEIYRSNLPVAEKERVIKAITTGFPYRAEQQSRLNYDSTLKRYNSRIREEENRKKSTADYKERKQIDRRIKLLQEERDKLLNFAALQQDEEIEKQKFDKNNPSHMEIFNSLNQEFNGDKVKINQALNKRFVL